MLGDTMCFLNYSEPCTLTASCPGFSLSVISPSIAGAWEAGGRGGNAVPVAKLVRTANAIRGAVPL